jgi:hypothetical protein
MFSFLIKLVMFVMIKGHLRNAYKILVGKPEAKRPLGRPRRTCRIILKGILRKQGVWV